MIDFNKLLSLDFVSDVQSICSPLFKAFNFNYYDYARFYKDGRCIVLFSDPEWVRTFLNDDYTPPVNILPEGLNPWRSYIGGDILSIADNEFKHKSGITVFRRGEEYDEIFNLATSQDHSFLEGFYANHQVFLKQFSLYFQDKAAPIIQKLEQTPIILDCGQEQLRTSPDENQFKKFFELLEIESPYDSEFFVGSSQVTLSKLTPKEQECFALLSKGMSAKRIGQHMKISYRTVEKHIAHIKEKFNCNRSMELLSIGRK